MASLLAFFMMLCLGGLPAFAAGGITVDQSTNGGSSTSFTIGTSQPNELILIAADGWPCSGAQLVTVDSSPAALIASAGGACFGPNSGGATVFQFAAPTAGIHNVAIVSEGSYCCGYYNNFAVSLLNATTTGLTSTSTIGPTTPSITTSTANEYVFATSTINTGRGSGAMTWSGSPVTPTLLQAYGLCCGIDASIAGFIAPTAGSYSANLSDTSGPFYPQDQVSILVAVPSALDPTALTYTGATGGDFNDPATVSAQLVDTNTNRPVPNESVTFTLNGTETCTGTSDSNGKASCSITPGEAAGPYTLSVSFAGDSSYAASSTTSPFTVTNEETTTTYTGASGPILNGSTVTLSGVLKEDGTTPISGRTLTLTLGTGVSAQSCTGTTDGTASASCPVAVNQPLGPGTVSANFAGDGYYLPSSDSKSTLVYALAPGGGAFVVGNESATGTVTFWGAQWSKLNSLSGGSAPASFKGFALNPTTPTCGATWSADPGNSSPPPAGPLPAYMGVIVSSSISKSGSQISGNTKSIVIVKTNTDYQNDPGHAGTGTVVATVC
jgi:hypothetical protein